MADYFYPYECLRLACERLYGQAACYVQYSKDIPSSEFSNEDQDMVVSEVTSHHSPVLSVSYLSELLMDNIPVIRQNDMRISAEFFYL